MIEFQDVQLANFLGFLALFSYIATLLPTLLRVVFPATRKHKIPTQLLKYRRQLGILAFLLTLAHAVLFVTKRNFDFFDIRTYEIYFQGVTTFIIFIILTLTSNDWSVKKLKKNWKTLHQLTYCAMFLLAWHIWDKMSEHWSLITPLGILAIAATIILFLKRRWIEWQQQKAKEQKSQPAQQTATTTYI